MAAAAAAAAAGEKWSATGAAISLALGPISHSPSKAGASPCVADDEDDEDDNMRSRAKDDAVGTGAEPTPRWMLELVEVEVGEAASARAVPVVEVSSSLLASEAPAGVSQNWPWSADCCMTSLWETSVSIVCHAPLRLPSVGASNFVLQCTRAAAIRSSRRTQPSKSSARCAISSATSNAYALDPRRGT